MAAESSGKSPPYIHVPETSSVSSAYLKLRASQTKWYRAVRASLVETLLGSGECVQDALHDELLSARNAAYIERLNGLLFYRQVALADDDPCWTSLCVA